MYSSFGHTPHDKRKQLNIAFARQTNVPDNDQLLSTVWASLGPSLGGGVAVAWEHVFFLPEDTYILVFENLTWLASPVLQRIMEEVAIVSPSKAIIKLQPQITTKDAEHVFSAYNALKNLQSAN